jgi:hypothetical protein
MRDAFINGIRTMIKLLGERGEYMNALAVLPDGAEFLALNSILDENEKGKLELMAAATKAIGDMVDAHPDRNQKGIRADELYDGALGGAKIRERWEKSFGRTEEGRELFGLVAWRYFFDHKSTWFAKASDTPGLGKRGWTYMPEAEPEASSLDATSESRILDPVRNLAKAELNGLPQTGISPQANAAGTEAPATTFDRSKSPSVDSEAWVVMNRRRGELIRKKNRDGLTDAEQVEYDQLQELSLEALEKAFPRPISLMDKLMQLRAKLDAESEYQQG